MSRSVQVPTIIDERQNTSAGESNCLTCKIAVQGQFCSNCGQPRQHSENLGDLLREWRERVFGNEAIRWRTLYRLIVAPGGLTRDWCDGRRLRIMSPVRTLLVVLMGGALLATLEHLLLGRAEVDVGKLVAAFSYELVAVSLIVNLAVLPALLPRTRRPSSYEVASFALYEGAFIGLGAAAFYGSLIIAPHFPDMLPRLGGPVVPLAWLLLLGHSTWHLKTTFGLSWFGAAVRVPLLVAPICFGMLIASVVLAATGLDRFWMPTAP